MEDGGAEHQLRQRRLGADRARFDSARLGRGAREQETFEQDGGPQQGQEAGQGRQRLRLHNRGPRDGQRERPFRRRLGRGGGRREGDAARHQLEEAQGRGGVQDGHAHQKGAQKGFRYNFTQGSSL